MVSTSDAPGARLLTTTELEPLAVVNTGLFSTASGSKVKRILEAVMSLDAFFIFTFSVKS